MIFNTPDLKEIKCYATRTASHDITRQHGDSHVNDLAKWFKLKNVQYISSKNLVKLRSAREVYDGKMEKYS